MEFDFLLYVFVGDFVGFNLGFGFFIYTIVISFIGFLRDLGVLKGCVNFRDTWNFVLIYDII